MNETDLRSRLQGRLDGLRSNRYSWYLHWMELANYIFPRRYKWLITPNQYNRGSPINGFIIDSTGTLAARNCASGMLAGIVSPTRPWVRLRIPGISDDDSSPATLWLSEVERRMMAVFQESNFYNAMGVLFHDLVVFGTGVMTIMEDYEDVIRCYNPCAGEYFLDSSYRMIIDTIYREFTLTCSQVIEKFPDDPMKWSATVQLAKKSGGAALTQEVVICCAIEPNDPPAPGIPKSFPYREVYWEQGSTTKTVLEIKGFYEFPAICPRWDIVSNDAYGRSPAMDALGDIKQLQQETRRKGQAIDKMVNPPMVADVQMKNQPASLLPGGVTYVSGFAQSGKAGFAPAYQVQPQIEHMSNDIMQVQERIKTTFFNDLFLMISGLDTVRTATEIDARREEKLVMLGPVLERFQNEGLDPLIDRTFKIMLRNGLLPPPPEEIQGATLKPEYVSILAMAQRAASTSGIERVYALVGNMTAVNPSIRHKLNYEETVEVYGSSLNIPPKLLVSKEEFARLVSAEAQQLQADKAAALTPEIVKGAKTLSETDLSSRNALTALIGQGAAA